MRAWLKEARQKRGLTQKEVAEKLFISESYYSCVESGDRQKKMDISFASALATILCLPIADVISLELESSAPP